MAGLGGLEVGRVHIRVVPDFKYFRKIMDSVLKEYSNRSISIKVGADRSDLAGLSKSVSKAVGKASKDTKISPTLTLTSRYKRRMQAELEKTLNDFEVNLPLRFGENKAADKRFMAGIREKFDKDYADIQELLSNLEPEMDRRTFAADAAWITATINKLKDDIKAAPSKPDYGLLEQLAKLNEINRDNNKAIADSRALLQNWNQSLKDAAGSGERIDAAFNKAFGFQQRQALREYVYGYRELNGEVNKYINTNASGGMGRGVFGNIKESVSSIQQTVERSKLRGGILGGLFGGAASLGILETAKKGIEGVAGAAGKAAGVAGGLAKSLSPQGLGLNVSMAGFVAIAGAITLVAAPAIGLLTAALLTIPGILATVMAPIAAITLGFGGIKKAAENAGLFGDKNGDKKGGGSLGKALEEIQKNTEGVFERTLTKPFEQIGEAANALIAPMQTVAQGAADVMKNIIDSITSEANVSRISETFKGIGVALSNSFGPGLAKFTDGLIGLAAEFTKPGGALEGLGKWFDDTMGDFKNWVNEGIKSGELTETFRQLGDSLRIVLELAGDLAQKGLDFVSDPAKMQGFKDTLREIADLLGKVMTLSRDLGPLWTALGGLVGAAADPFSKLGKAIDDPSLKNFDELARSLIPDGSTGFKIAQGWFNKDAMNQAAVEAGNSAAEKFNVTTAAVMAANKETQKAMLREAFTGEGITTAVQTQMTQQAQIAITGVQQALVPLKEGLQTDINAALMPLGDIAGKVQAAFDGVPAMVQGSLGQIPGIVTTAMGTLATDAQTAMQGVSDAVIEHCGIAVNTATTEAPKIKAPFDELDLSSSGAAMMAGLAKGIENSVGFAEAAARAAAIRVKDAADKAAGIRSPSREFMKTGDYMMQGMQVGIEDGTKGPVAAMREVMQAIKDVFGSAEGLNLNFFMGEAKSSMSSMAETSKEFRTNMTEVATTPMSSGLDSTTTDLADIKRQKAEIDLQIAQLQAQKNATTDKAAKAGLTAEIDALRIQKERLDLLKEENGLQEERKTAIQKLSDTIATNIVDMIKMPGEFAKTTANAAMQDIGISGSGALPTIANWAMDAGTNFIFNVNNMDDAIQGQQAQQNKQVAGRVSR